MTAPQSGWMNLVTLNCDSSRPRNEFLCSPSHPGLCQEATFCITTSSSTQQCPGIPVLPSCGFVFESHVQFLESGQGQAQNQVIPSLAVPTAVSCRGPDWPLLEATEGLCCPHHGSTWSSPSWWRRPPGSLPRRIPSLGIRAGHPRQM